MSGTDIGKENDIHQGQAPHSAQSAAVITPASGPLTPASRRQ
jgi:hypothetical protein